MSTTSKKPKSAFDKKKKQDADAKAEDARLWTHVHSTASREKREDAVYQKMTKQLSAGEKNVGEVTEYFLYTENTFYAKRIQSIQRGYILYKEDTFYTKRLHCIQRDCILYKENTFYTKRPIFYGQRPMFY